MKSIKFHTFVGGEWIQIKLYAGMKTTHYAHQRTEEGWSSQESTWEYDGETVTIEHVSDGSDCDGRLTQESKSTATTTRPYQETKYDFKKFTSVPYGRISHVLDCTPVDSCQ